jgi:hypothetical protein
MAFGEPVLCALRCAHGAHPRLNLRLPESDRLQNMTHFPIAEGLR